MDNITHLEIPTDEIKKGIALIETEEGGISKGVISGNWK